MTCPCGAAGKELVLRGDFVAVLCIDHLNAWHEFVTHHPAYERLLAAIAAERAVETLKDATPELWTMALSLMAEVERELFTLAKEFVAGITKAQA